MPACPPGAWPSITSVSSPSDAAYTAAASPAGPAPTTTTSKTCSGSIVSEKPSASASSAVHRVAQHDLVRVDHHGQLVRAQLVAREEAVRVRVDLGVEHPVRVAVAGEEAPQAQRVGCVARPDQHHAALRVLDQSHAAQDEVRA